MGSSWMSWRQLSRGRRARCRVLSGRFCCDDTSSVNEACVVFVTLCRKGKKDDLSNKQTCLFNDVLCYSRPMAGKQVIYLFQKQYENLIGNQMPSWLVFHRTKRPWSISVLPYFPTKIFGRKRVIQTLGSVDYQKAKASLESFILAHIADADRKTGSRAPSNTVL